MGRYKSSNSAATFFVKDEKAKEKKQSAQTQKTDFSEDFKQDPVVIRETKSERLHLLVYPSLKRELKKCADQQGLTLNDLVNKILKRYMEGR